MKTRHTHRSTHRVLLGALASALSLVGVVPCALAQEADEAAADDGGGGDSLIYERGGLSGIGLVAGGKLGGGFSQPFSDLGSSFVGELELGYTLPPLQRSIEIFLSGQYTAPSASGNDISDVYGPTVNGDPQSRIPGTMSYEVTQQQAIITLGGLYRLKLPVPLFRPYGGLGGRMYLMRTKITGEAGGEPFGENEETATQFGFVILLGGELYLGPGALLLEIQSGYASADGFILRDTNVGALNLALGYRLFI